MHVEPVRPQSRQMSFALDAIAAALEVLAGAPESEDKRRLISEAHACEEAAREWKQQAPSAEQREGLMKRVLKIHVATARLRRGAEPSAAPQVDEPRDSDRPTSVPSFDPGDFAAKADAATRSEPPQKEVTAARMLQLLRDGALEDALAQAQALLDLAPLHADARQVAKKCTALLERDYSSRLAPLDRVLRLVITHEELALFQLEPAAMALVALVGGGTSVEGALAACGQSRLSALRTLCNLVDRGVLALD